MQLNDTGRLQSGLWPAAHRAAYHIAEISADHLPLLKRHWEIHKAHALMLIACGIQADAGRLVLAALDRAERAGFANLLGRKCERGLYLATESWLFQEIGEAAGTLHTGRSRNDLNATEQRLALRLAWRRISGQLLSLAGTLADQAERYRDLPMPIHTHFQPGVLSTLGHWFAGCAGAVLRLHERALAELPHLNLCPLGAAAIGGTSHPIDPQLSARLLGFDRPFANSVDAIASRDHLLALFGLATNVAHFVSRVAQDYRFRTTIELGWFHLPDGLAGGSSALPQKKNAWLLELAIARSTRVLGSFVGFFTSSFGEPYTNTIPAGGEALAGASEAVDDLVDALILLRLHIRHLIPNEARLAAARWVGFPFAQAMAEGLAREGLTARAAHYKVGRLVRENSEPSPSKEGGRISAANAFLDPALLAHGGGPGAFSSEDAQRLRSAIASQVRQRRAAMHQWKMASRQLRQAAREAASIPSQLRFDLQKADYPYV